MINLIKYESQLWEKGVELIAGVDEAGRGPLAGPMVVSAVILKKESLEILKEKLNTGSGKTRNYDVGLGEISKRYSLINDSKKLTKTTREKLYKFIISEAKAFSIIEISHSYIDQKGITASTQKGFKKAVISLEKGAEHILTDHVCITDLDQKLQTNITKGDSLSISIAAASILAKVHRDNLMCKYAKKFPQYGFEKHKGYGTKTHREAIFKFGPCEIHRKSFKPVKTYIHDQDAGKI